MLTLENFEKGFLVDDEFIGGVSEMMPGLFVAYVSHYLSGETVTYQEFSEAKAAIEFLNGQPRQWSFEKAGGCSGGGCGGGGCGGGGCGGHDHGENEHGEGGGHCGSGGGCC